MNIPAVEAQRVEENPAEMEGVTIEDKLGETIPLDITLTDQDGKRVALADYFNRGRPVVITMVYYDCPMLCTLVLNGLVDAMHGTDMEPGEDFTILTASIDPGETAELAASKRTRYQQAYGKSIENGWYFHVDQGDNAKRLADALGFKYYFDEKKDQYVHPAGVFILTESGKLSRVLYGISFPPRDLKLGLLEAAEGKIGSVVDKLILFCFHYDPDEKSYAVFATNMMKLGGLATVGFLTLFLGTLWTRERIRKRRTA